MTPYLSHRTRIMSPADKPSNCLPIHPDTTKSGYAIGDSEVKDGFSKIRLVGLSYYVC